MNEIYLYGAVLILAALAILVWPLLKHRAEPGITLIALGLIIGFPLTVAVTYNYVNTYDWDDEFAVPTAAEQDEAIDGLVRELAERLKKEPNVEGWVLLGRSYAQLGRYQESADAFYEAWNMTEGNRPEISMDYAEALILADNRSLRTGAGDLIDDVLAARPNDPRGLWYGGLSAAARDNQALAAERWSRLLQLELPANMRSVVQQQLAGLSLPPGDTPAAAPEKETNIAVTIDIAPELKNQIVANEFLFLIARDQDQPMPPVAVKRVRVGAFPVTIKIGDSNVMIPGRSLADVTNLALVARISKSGNAFEAAGDLTGLAVPAGRADSPTASIVINQVVGD